MYTLSHTHPSLHVSLNLLTHEALSIPNSSQIQCDQATSWSGLAAFRLTAVRAPLHNSGGILLWMGFWFPIFYQLSISGAT